VAVRRSVLSALLGFFFAFAAQAERPRLNSDPVFNRDYRFLADPAQRTDFFDPLKYIPLDNSDLPTEQGEARSGGERSVGGVPPSKRYLSFGGEIRQRYESQFNPNFGLGEVQKEDYLLSRTLLHADFHLNQNFRSFAQLGHHDVYGKDAGATQRERSSFDLQQAFAETFLPYYDPKHKFSLRAGRQETLFGNQRFLSLSDRGNIRRSFDAVRAKLYWGEYKFTAFAGRPVLINPNGFDDSADPRQFLSGFYAFMPGFDKGHFDAYYFRFNRDNARFAQATGNEERDTIGIRLEDREAPFDYNNELIYQFGSFDRSDINAWIAVSDSGYTLQKTPLLPRIGLRASIASGDSDLNDNTLETFNPILPSGRFFAQNGLIGPTNFFNFQPNLSITPRDNVTLSTGFDFFWRTDTADAIYRHPNTPISGTAGNPERFTGSQFSLLGNWQVTPHVEASATYVHFFAGEALQQARAGDTDYIATWVNFRF
jgi:hypothetical protein